MIRVFSLSWCLVCATALWGQVPPREKKPEDSSWPAPLPSVDDDPPPANPLTDLRLKLDRLKAARKTLSDDTSATSEILKDPLPLETEETAKLRLRLSSLLTQLALPKSAPMRIVPPAPKKDEKRDATTPAPKAPAIGETPPKKESSEPLSADDKRVLEPLALAQALYLAGDYKGALLAYEKLPTEGLKAEDRVPIQYMIAACHKKIGNLDKATALFREVGNSPGDETLAQCAQWQLAHLRWHKELKETLQQLQKRRKALDSEP